MRAFSRPAEVVVVGLVVLLGVALTGSALTAVGGGSEQATCTARLALFGQASAQYETMFGTFAPCDPWPPIPYCVGETSTDCRGGDSTGDQFEPAHNWLAFYGLGLRPNIPVDDDRFPWNDDPFGFTYQGRGDINSLWNGFFCPSQHIFHTTSPDSPEIDFGWDYASNSELGVLDPQASGYMLNRLLRSPARDDRRLPRLPGPPAGTSSWNDNDNAFSTPYVNLNDSVVGGVRSGCYLIQGINTDELIRPTETVYMADSLDYRIGDEFSGDVLLDNRYTDADRSAGTYMGMNCTKGVVLGARHGGQANVLYADGHVSDDNQTPRNQRDDMITASTFADFLEDDAGFGSQHHLSPGYRFYDTSPDQSGGFAPGDDEPPIVIGSTPEDGGGISTWYATEVRIQFSEAVLVNETNVTVNGGAIAPTAVTYDAHATSAVLTFDPKLEPGEFTVEISPAVTDAVGNQLDGDGDGIGGDAYTFNFTVRPTIRAYSMMGGITRAASQAVDGDVIVLLPGSYREPSYFAGKRILVTSKDPNDEAIVGDTVIHSSGDPGAIFNQGEGRGTILQGVTIDGDGYTGIEIDGASPTIRQCVFENCNSAIVCTDGAPVIERCLFRNSNPEHGVIASYGSDPIIRNCIFRDNSAADMASCLYLIGPGQPLILNNTFVKNDADWDAFGAATILCFAADATIDGNIFWQNTAWGSDRRDVVAFDATLAVQYNLFQNLDQRFFDADDLAVGHNFSADPMLVERSYGYDGYLLDLGSPCIEASKPVGGLLHGTHDHKGAARFSGDQLDVGADEFMIVRPQIVDIASQRLDAWAGQEYRLTLELAQPTPATWTLLTGPSGAAMTEPGVVSGWTPTVDQIGTTVTFEVQADNIVGSDTITWEAVVTWPRISETSQAAISGPLGSAWGTDVVADVLGNAFVVGRRYDTSSNATQWFVAKYATDPNGLEADWIVPFTDVSSWPDMLIAADGAGGVYVAASDDGVVTARIDPNGVEAWRVHHPDTTQYETPWGIATDSAGNVIVTAGYYRPNWPGFGGRWVTVKYDRDGIEAWTRVREQTYDVGTAPTCIAVGPDDSVYVAGTDVMSVIDAESWILRNVTVKYAPDGTHAWTATTDEVYNHYIFGPQDIAITDAGDVYVSASTSSPSTQLTQTLTIRYDAMGSQQWAVTYPTAEDEELTGNGVGLALNPKGGVHVVGTTTRMETDFFGVERLLRSFILLQYDGGGNLLSRTPFEGDPYAIWWHPTATIDVESDAVGHVYVRRQVEAQDGCGSHSWDHDVTTFDGDGRVLWATSYDGGSEAGAMAVDRQGRVFVTGKHENRANCDEATQCVTVMVEQPPAMVATNVPTTGTLAKQANNVVEMTFNQPIEVGASPAIRVLPLDGGEDAAAGFDCTVEPDGVTLRVVENGAVLANRAWYRLRPSDGLFADMFALDVCKLIGDADGNGQVLASDLGLIWSLNAEMSDGRCDINGDGQVLATDIGATWAHNGEAVPAKP